MLRFTALTGLQYWHVTWGIHQKTSTNFLIFAMSRTHQTEDAYRNRAVSLQKTCRRETGKQTVNGFTLVAWFLKHHDTWAPSTIRQYRAALAQLVRDSLTFGRLTEAQAESLLQKLTGELSETKRQVAPRPSRVSRSQRRSRVLHPKSAAKIRDRLDSLRRPAAAIASKIVATGVELGLRSCEWDSLVVEDHTIRVDNAKHTNGRANGAHRHIELLIDDDSDQILTTVKDLVTAIRDSGIPWERLHRRINYALKCACRDARLKPQISLGTLRHVAIGRWKARYSRKEVAALSGHASDASAGRHYGRRRSGRQWPPTLVLPSLACIANVRLKHREYETQDRSIRPN